MSSIVLGFTPHDLTVVLTRGADFFTTIKKKTGSWTPGIAITMVIGDTSFPFEIEDEYATLVIDKAAVETLIDARVTKSKLLYNEGTADVAWALGAVVSRG